MKNSQPRGGKEEMSDLHLASEDELRKRKLSHIANRGVLLQVCGQAVHRVSVVGDCPEATEFRSGLI